MNLKLKSYLIWTLRALLLCAIIFIGEMFSDDFEMARLPTLVLLMMCFALSIGSVLFLIETYYIPKRKKSLIQKLIRTFDAALVDDSTVSFELFDFRILASVEISANPFKGQAQFELVSFHVHQDQVNDKKNKFTLSRCNNQPTYQIYTTNGHGIRFAKSKLEKLVRSIEY